MSKYCWQLSPI